MGEEKVNSVEEKENLGKVILEIGGLTAAAFMLCSYGVSEIFRGIFQGSYSYLGVLSFTFGIVFVGLSCMATLKGGMLKNLKKYVKGEYEEKNRTAVKEMSEGKVIFAKEDFWKVILKACGLAMIASVFFTFGAISILQSNLPEALSSFLIILCILLWGFACFVITRKMTEKLKKM